MDGHESAFSDFFEDDIFSVLEAWESSDAVCDYNNNNSNNPVAKKEKVRNMDEISASFEFQKSACDSLSGGAAFQESETELEAAAAASSPKTKRQKLINNNSSCEEAGQQRRTHITVERNRRKQMNENLSVLRSLMPCFYVKRGDQASIIGGVVDYITELQQVLQSLEAKKQRKAYTEVLSPRPSPLSPRLNLPKSPSTPQSSSPYKPWMHQQYSLPSPVDPSPAHSSTSSINDAVNELVGTSKSAVAEVEVKFSGPNLLLKTVSRRIPGQAVKIVSALEELALEILQVNISTVDETMLNSFTIKIGIECQLSAEELAHQIQQTFTFC